ncbi:MAG: metallopeptidase TldD-related protein [Chloroflexia bacterium]
MRGSRCGRRGGLASYGSGYARDAAHRPVEIVETAIAKAMPLPYADPSNGAYPAVLEPSATADLLAYLARDARVFSADERQGGLGLRLAPGEDAELVSLLEDPLSPDGLLSPFDAEGVARTAVPLVSRGSAADLVHDKRTAARAGVSSTGHAAHPAAALGATGPTPCSISMEHGEGELEGMIAATGDGLLLSRLTGLTPVGRDGGLVSGVATGGVFRIQSGIVTHRLPDLPFVAASPHCSPPSAPLVASASS